MGGFVKQAKATQKKTAVKKNQKTLAEKGLKKIKVIDLREKLANSKQPVFILLGNEKYEIPSGGERIHFLEALFETADLRSAQQEGNILTTQEVADLLNVSRPYVVKLIEDKKLKSFKVGSHRRVYEIDAIEFRKKMRHDQNEALDQLAEETQKLGLEFK